MGCSLPGLKRTDFVDRTGGHARAEGKSPMSQNDLSSLYFAGTAQVWQHLRPPNLRFASEQRQSESQGQSESQTPTHFQPSQYRTAGSAFAAANPDYS
jgi:hypothetical protein